VFGALIPACGCLSHRYLQIEGRAIGRRLEIRRRLKPAPLVVLLCSLLNSPLFTQTPVDTFDRREEVAPGLTLRERRFFKNGAGPFTMQTLEFDPSDKRVNLVPVRATGRPTGKETVSTMAQRHGAAAAINAGYFFVMGPYAGGSTGVYKWNGSHVASGGGRTALQFCSEKDFIEHLEMSTVDFRGIVTAGPDSILLRGMNRPREAEDLVVYTPGIGERTLAPPGGFEVALDDTGRVVSAGESVTIPRIGLALSAAGDMTGWLRRHSQLGSHLSVEVRLDGTYCETDDVIGAGPKLVIGGKAAVVSEGFAHERVRHPRTAIARTRRGTVLLVTVDGRQATSVGMTLDELALELVSLGAEEAMNLDGGGSTTMWAAGRIRNSPSDRTGERAVGDALLLFVTNSLADLKALTGKLVRDETAAAAMLARLDAGDLTGFRALAESQPALLTRILIEAAAGLAVP
jgi:hypothetical protein